MSSAYKPMEKEMSAGLHFVRALTKAGEVRDGAHFQRKVIRLLVEGLLASVGDERPVVGECEANSAVTMLFWLRVLLLKFMVGDWKAAPVVVVTAKRQVLQIKELELHEEDGVESFGLAGSVENKPVIGVTANPGFDPLFVRIGGFDRAAVSYDGRARLVAVFAPCRKLCG
jgi:hypothetical protein